MCFTVLLSTNCPDDLCSQNGNGICFQPADGQSVRAAAMPYARNYDVAGDGSGDSHGGCGCCFSFYGDGAFAEYGFCEPEMTSPEMLEHSPMRETLYLQEVSGIWCGRAGACSWPQCGRKIGADCCQERKWWRWRG